jgi:nitrile hydratase subunit beta
MNGVHDLGGMQGMGLTAIERNEPVFHRRWEGRTFALTLATAWLGRWNIDMGRHARERMPGSAYLAASYYERWLFGLELLLVERGLVSREEMASKQASSRETEGTAVRADAVEAMLRKPRGFKLKDEIPPRFQSGDAVITRNLHPEGHTRLPRYARGRRGTVERDHGVFVFADANAMGDGPRPQHLYGVRFAASELWGPDSSPRDSVHLDLWDAHLDPA